MRKFLTKVLTLSLCTTIVFGCVACGGGKESASDSGTSTQKVKIVVPDLITGKKGLNAWELQRQEEFKKAYPNIEVEYKSNPTTDPAKNIQAMITNLSNQEMAYTLLKANSNTYARTVYQSKLTCDVSKYMTAEQIAEYDSSVLSGYYDGNALVGLPFRQEFPLLGFNRKHLQSEYVKTQLGIDPAAADANEQVEAKIDAIETWDDFLEIAKKLSGTYAVSGKNVTVSGYGGYLTDYYIGLGVWNVANGYNTVTQHESGKMDIDMTNTQTVETLEFLQKLKNEGALTHNTNLGYTDFFNQIFQNKIASFIYYPTWATSWFEPNGIFASDVKVINIPYGPSIAALKEKAKTDSTVKVPSTNVNFSLSYVLNSRATEEQKQAAITYVMFMHGEEAVHDKIEFAKENMVSMLTVPPYPFDDTYLSDTLFANVPSDWKKSLTASIKDYYVFNQNSDAFIQYIATAVPGIVNGKDGSGTYNTRESLLNRLTSLNGTIYSQFLNGYNSNFD